ncbi:tripartite tricarboxylate transporter substrate binding protein [Sediminicoccus sp. KRV36]|uniref:tripartite tricarboxylate transporter substrate binding protein n=1 Tax=Sediminicoccus sp. KRV36 TaxID=3133721 RepID=UPI00200FE941|nr:tripartite tricarboxylate transporter substrate binding protein [Sediminicoccus rosea]UPY37934.1 tripartite tricarboxylate transporter substrate binding protein [Sediminicoccus rosea]
MGRPANGLSRRHALAMGGAAMAAPLAAPGVASGQGRFPERPIRFIIPWPPGGSSDSQLRSLGEQAGRLLGQPVVIENRGGAGGTLHAVYLAREARPDGYTIGQMHLSVIRRPFLVRTPQWDATTDFTHIIGLTGWLFGAAVRADSPFRTWQDMIAFARQNPGAVSYATSGIATTNHLAMEDICARERVEMTHVPFRGASEGIPAVLSGNVTMIADSSTWAPAVDGGQMRCLSVWSAERAPRFPTVPTLRELGYDIVVTSNYGISGPPRMDPGVVRVLHDAFKTALMSEENTRVRTQFDMPLVYLNTQEYKDFVAQRAVWERDMVTRLGIRME